MKHFEQEYDFQKGFLEIFTFLVALNSDLVGRDIDKTQENHEKPRLVFLVFLPPKNKRQTKRCMSSISASQKQQADQTLYWFFWIFSLSVKCLLTLNYDTFSQPYSHHNNNFCCSAWQNLFLIHFPFQQKGLFEIENGSRVCMLRQ